MGGGRNSFFGDTRRTPDQIRAVAEKAVADQAFSADVNRLLDARLAVVNARDAEETRSRLDAILNVLHVPGEDRVELLMGGSVAKRTYLEGLSDIDALVVLADEDLIAAGPEIARARLAALLGNRLDRQAVETIREGTLAVTVTYRDGPKIQLLPAARHGDHVLIASKDGKAWSEIRPKAFMTHLTDANQRLVGRLVPVIKLAKLVISSFPESHRLSGYHVESLAIDAFRGYDGPTSYRGLLQHFFASAAKRVLAPMTDKTGQSVHVDDDLGPEESTTRRLMANSLDRTARRMATTRSIGEWEKLVTLPED